VLLSKLCASNKAERSAHFGLPQFGVVLAFVGAISERESGRDRRVSQAISEKRAICRWGAEKQLPSGGGTERERDGEIVRVRMSFAIGID